MPASDAAAQPDPAGGEAQFVTLPGCGFSGPIVMEMVGVFLQNAALEPPQPAVQRLLALFDGARPARPWRRKTAPNSGRNTSIVARRGGRTADRRRRALPRTSPKRTWRRLPQSYRLLGLCGFWLRLYASARTRARKARVRSCCGRVSTSTAWPCSTITPPSMKIR
jgi:hypothetical protein